MIPSLTFALVYRPMAGTTDITSPITLAAMSFGIAFKGTKQITLERSG